MPLAALLVPVFGLVSRLGGAAAYAPVPLMILLHAIGLRFRLPELVRGLCFGAGMLILSILFRALYALLCSLWPPGTHVMWHVWNAIMLGWMIELYRRFAG